MLILFKRFTLVLVLLFLVAGCSKSSEPEPMPATSAPSTTYVSPSLAPEYYEAMEIVTAILELDKLHMYTDISPRPAFPRDLYSEYLTVEYLDWVQKDYERFNSNNISFKNARFISYEMRPMTGLRRGNSIAQIKACVNQNEMTISEPGYPEYPGGIFEMEYFLNKDEGKLKVIGATAKVIEECEL